MNIKNIVLLLLVCVPNIITSKTTENERIFSDSDFELKTAYVSWAVSLDYQAAEFACKVFVQNRCSHLESLESKERDNLFMECMYQSFHLSPQYKKYCELRKLHENKEEPVEPGNKSQSILATTHPN